MFFLFNLFNPILIAAAVLPAVFLLIWVYKNDELDQEPPALLLRLVFWGAVSTVAAMALEYAGSYLLARLADDSSSAYDFIYYFIVVGLSEEVCKYFFLRRRTWYSDTFNCQFDGVVYAVFISLGFALAENISYTFSYGLGTAFVRAVTAIPGHACFGVFMGAWYGIAKRCDNFGYPEKSLAARILCVVFPALLHGIYDYCATRDSAIYSTLFIVFIAIMFIVAFRLVRKLSDQDRYIY